LWRNKPPSGRDPPLSCAFAPPPCGHKKVRRISPTNPPQHERSPYAVTVRPLSTSPAFRPENPHRRRAPAIRPPDRSTDPSHGTRRSTTAHRHPPRSRAQAQEREPLFRGTRRPPVSRQPTATPGLQPNARALRGTRRSTTGRCPRQGQEHPARTSATFRGTERSAEHAAAEVDRAAQEPNLRSAEREDRRSHRQPQAPAQRLSAPRDAKIHHRTPPWAIIPASELDPSRGTRRPPVSASPQPPRLQPDTDRSAGHEDPQLGCASRRGREGNHKSANLRSAEREDRHSPASPQPPRLQPDTDRSAER